jgi:protein TonB
MSKRLKHRVDPIYPQLARQQAVEGTVKLQIIVSTDGAVTQAKLLSGPGLLTKAAVDAVLQWTYEPTSISNQVVEVETNVDIVFKLASKITDSTPDR